MVGLTVIPDISLVDEPVKIQAWGLAPQQLITLRAWLEDEKREIFHSQAFYRSDDNGKVDLEHSPATGGDFHGVHPMGLFWSLKSSLQLKLMKWDVMGSPFYVHLELYSHLEFNPMPESAPAASKRLERWYVSPGVQRVLIREGRVRGTLFIPPGEGPFPGVIDLFGSTKGLVEVRSSLLASHGFACLALAYFAYDDLPKSLDHLDLKYFAEAAELLSSHPKVSGEGLGVVGLSKGAEIALAMASYLPQVVATVCINGTTTVSGSSTLRYGDLLLRGIPYNKENMRYERLLFNHSGSIDYSCMRGDMRDPEYQDSVLHLEKARGPILFLVGEKDQCQDSLLFAKEALARAEKYNKKDVYMRCYPGAGHLLEPDGSPFCPLSRSVRSDVTMMWGGELVAHCRAQEVSWKEMQDFLRRNIPCSRRNKL